MAALALIGALLLLGPAPAAQALEERLEFSRDGVTWASVPPEALFERSVVLVPGGSATAALHVRSTAETPGVLAASVTNVRTTGPEAEEYFGLQARTDTGTGNEGAGVGLDRTRVADLAEHTLLGAPFTLESGQSAAFTLTIDLDLRPGGTGAQNSAIGLDLAISFTDAAATGGGPGAGAEDEPPMSLPVLPPGENGPQEGGASSAPARAGAPDGSVIAPTERERAGAEGADGAYPGFLAVTGIARSTIVAAVALPLVGAVLMLASRIRRERTGAREAGASRS